MRLRLRTVWVVGFLTLSFALSGCVTAKRRPCQDAGDPARENPFKGNRRCSQKRGPDGKYLNHGLYQEWHPNGKLALEGFYKMGRKDAWWTEYNPDGKKISDKFFDDGVEVPEKVRK